MIAKVAPSQISRHRRYGRFPETPRSLMGPAGQRCRVGYPVRCPLNVDFVVSAVCWRHCRGRREDRSGEIGRADDHARRRAGHRQGARLARSRGRTTTARFGTGAYRGNVGICGLCGMAFMSGGSTPGRGPYGEQVDRAVDYLLANAQQSGFISEPSREQPRPDVRPRLRHAVPGRVLRHVAAGRNAGEARQGRQADRQLAEQRRRLALLSEAATTPTSRSPSAR